MPDSVHKGELEAGPCFLVSPVTLERPEVLRCTQSSAVFKVLSHELTKQNPYCVSQVTVEETEAWDS